MFKRKEFLKEKCSICGSKMYIKYKNDKKYKKICLKNDHEFLINPKYKINA